ncbi:MAG: hypothetical protein ACLSHC_10160 [Bilophila wadsworthia]
MGMSWQNDYGCRTAFHGVGLRGGGFMVASYVGVPLASWGRAGAMRPAARKELSSIS